MSKGANAAFDALLVAYYEAWFRYHPERAVDVGINGYADRLRPFDDDEIGALVALNEKLLAELELVAVDDLSPDRRIDLDVLEGAAHLEICELRESDWRHHNPNAFLPVDAIHQLFLKPVKDFAGALRARLEQIPAYLRGARVHLLQTPELVPVLWAESAHQTARAGADYIRSLERHPRVLQAMGSEGLHGFIEPAARALTEFAHFLEADLGPRCEGDFACGRAHFDRLLAQRHFLDVDADALHAFGRQFFDVTRRNLHDVTRELSGQDDPAVLQARIQAEHPDAEGLVAAYREAMERAHAFVVERDLVTVPDAQALHVVETPVFLRHQIPFAAYVEPAANDPAQTGHYYVTPPVDEAGLGEHHALGIAHTGVHEAWPGHHLQFVTAHRRPESRSLPRLLNPSATLYEGWALYCESLMHEQGFLDRPESRFVLLQDRLWRALRILIDVELHTRGLPLDEAAERMVETLGFGYSQAMGELTWYSQAPTVPMGYATGWGLVNAVRDRLRLSPDFALKGFHDGLLASGSIALPLVIRRQFGEQTWQSARNMIFGAGA